MAEGKPEPVDRRAIAALLERMKEDKGTNEKIVALIEHYFLSARSEPTDLDSLRRNVQADLNTWIQRTFLYGPVQ